MPVLAFVLASCTGDDTSAPKVSDEHVLSGVMQLVGGPSGTEPKPAPGTVTVTVSGGDVAASVRTAVDGTFEMQLRPGTYTLTGRSERYNSGDVDCVASDQTHVTDDDIRGVEVSCNMR
ncbi:MAG: hypothetical protein JWN29_3495 [Acidimicrobiales bacterium]|nr:hypothetical protein [Acidimicrobiales bacterium]